MTSIKDLNLSPETYKILADNGIKTIEGLSKFSEDELLRLKPYDYCFNPSYEMIKEIKTNLCLLGLSLESNHEERILDTEKRIVELNLPRVTIERLKRNRVVTTGVLSTLDEKDFSRMYRIGKGTLNNIKKVLPLENDKIKKINHKDMILKDLTREEAKYYEKQSKIVEANIAEEKRKYIEEEKQKRENIHRRELLLEMNANELYIPSPVLKNGKTITTFRLKDIIFIDKEDIKNSFEIENEISKLDIEGLHLGMNTKDVLKLVVSEMDLKKVEEYKLDRHIEELRVIEKIYEEKQKKYVLNEELKTNKNLVEYLENLIKENEMLREENDKYKAMINEKISETGSSKK